MKMAEGVQLFSSMLELSQGYDSWSDRERIWDKQRREALCLTVTSPVLSVCSHQPLAATASTFSFTPPKILLEPVKRTKAGERKHIPGLWWRTYSNHGQNHCLCGKKKKKNPPRTLVHFYLTFDRSTRSLLLRSKRHKAMAKSARWHFVPRWWRQDSMWEKPWNLCRSCAIVMIREGGG